ncbi:hypothetical protein L873DRAFT_757244 [Choiromyces venosus 120613-1]|uniref:Uncharacterized protein n=1 Tax=Choiromyces venosus 120613-1 TaxID=1336337 RepID=A0A3N4JQM3_9PEZI|nr:hypothetical protein L873DRAFT_757244 [Choiromyces venosus 120613-1]
MRAGGEGKEGNSVRCLPSGGISFGFIFQTIILLFNVDWLYFLFFYFYFYFYFYFLNLLLDIGTCAIILWRSYYNDIILYPVDFFPPSLVLLPTFPSKFSSWASFHDS